MKAWVTGAAGSIGAELVERLPDAVGTDLETDVTRPFDSPAADVCFHCAAAKHAPAGEADPYGVSVINITGTQNVLATGIPTVLASTCKAADPETAYGASKLIAERMVLNAGGWVARFHNVRQTSGNVFQIWAGLPETEPIPVAPCWRYFIDLDDAVDLMLTVPTLPPGRYAVDPGSPVWIPDLAAQLYPDRPLRRVEPRRGDRIREPFVAEHETVTTVSGRILRIHSRHDPC